MIAGSRELTPDSRLIKRVNSAAGAALSFLLAAAASVAATANAFAETSRPVRLAMILVSLIGLHLVMVTRLWFGRELKMYLVLMAFMAISLLWTHNVPLATDTLTLTVNFALILILFGSMVVHHSRPVVFAGMLTGFLAAAAYYTWTRHFPFIYPDDFSYNSIAGMYLYGLICTVMFGWLANRMLVTVAIGTVLLLLIAATTSIKTNLGIVLGAATAGAFYLGAFIRAIRRTLLLFVMLGMIMAAVITSNDALMTRVSAGVDRVGLGVGVLLAREDNSGRTEYGAREEWKEEGLKGWMLSPVFGNGLEEFRNDFGVTSHSTPVDLLYNSGIIGFGIFYALFLSILLRLRGSLDSGTSGLRAIILAALVCYAFITLSATMYYDVFLAVFVGVSGAMLSQRASDARPDGG